ncbi:class I SAM-dependent methyltransferase [Spirillospora sp. NPDC127200]
MTTAPHLVLDSAAPGTLDGRHLRAAAFQEVRLAYTRQILERLSPGRRALVVGGGRGPLPGGLAGLGLDVTAVDPSAEATALAGAAAGPPVSYRTAPAEALDVPAGSFDLAYCADTFEVVPDLDRVIAQAAAALRPGGVLVYDTVNRTPVSRLVYLGAFQAIPWTRIMPPGRYSADRLRPPSEVAAALARHGLASGGVCGFKPKSAAALVKAVRARRAGRITDEQVPEAVGFVLDPEGAPVVTYLGHAVREG